MLIGLIAFLNFHLDEGCDVDESDDETPDVTYGYLIKHKRVFFAAVAQFINIFVLTFGQPIFGPRMENDYGFSVALVGVSYALPCVTYALTGAVFLDMIAKNFEFRATIMIGFVIIFLGGILLGPSKVFHLPDKNVYMMMTGIAIFGIGAAFAAVPIIPEMLDSVTLHDKAHDKVSVIYNISGGLGQIVAPLLAGYLTDEVGFNMSLDICIFIVLAFLMLYFIFCNGHTAIYNSLFSSLKTSEGTEFNKFENETEIGRSEVTSNQGLKV